MKSKSLLFLFSFSVITIFIIGFNSCKKAASEDILQPGLSNSFNASAAKEWYYGVFKKSAEWKVYYAGTNKKTSKPNGIKLPDWKNGIYRKVGNMEIMEFPLHKAHKAVSVPSQFLTDGEKKKIAAASLTRIAFIKRGENIHVREIDYIPEWQYLQKKKFDISNVMFSKPGDDFTGRLFIKEWGGMVLSLNLVKDGKIVKKGRITKSNKNNVSLSARQICDYIETCVWQQDCVNYFVSDVLNETVCGDEYNTGECTTEEFCEEVEDDEGTGCDAATEDCLCLLYGICGDEGVGVGEEYESPPGCNMSESEGQQILNAMSFVDVNDISFIYGSEELDQYGIMRQAKTPRWDCIRINMGVGYEPMWSANFAAVRYKSYPGNDPWKWETFTYSNTTHSSGNFFPCTSVAMSTTVSCFIAGDKLSAHVALSFNANVKLTCTTASGAPLSRPINGNKSTQIFPTD